MPEVRRCVCLVLEQDDRGDVIGCVIEPASGAEVSQDAVREHCRARLAPFKVPRAVRAAPAGYQWPTTVSGKVPRGEVRTWWLETPSAVVPK